MNEAIKQQHQKELVELRARMYEARKREDELVMILGTLQAVDQQAAAEAAKGAE